MSIELPVTTRHHCDMIDNVESDVKPEPTNKQTALIQVVNMGTSSKKSKRNFVPMVHPGTLEVVPMVKNKVN